MSRIGKKPIEPPKGVTLSVAGRTVTVKGPKGQLTLEVPEVVEITLEGGVITLNPANDTKLAKALWGTMRARIANMVTGVTAGYEKSLELQGVGYRAAMKGTNLELALGYSHPVLITPGPGLLIQSAKPTEIKISGIDKQAVGQLAAEIRKVRPPEPYKGKGVRYVGETVRRKEGKKK
jgi:large subunit ribosomal protein L6